MKVSEVRRATDEELPDHWKEGRHRHGANPVVLQMENGDVIMASQDAELNGPGHLIGFNDDGSMFDFEVSMTQYEVVNENGEQFGGPYDTWDEAKSDRDACSELYDGHFYIEEVTS